MNSFSGVGRMRFSGESNQLNDGVWILSGMVEFPSGKYGTSIKVVRFQDDQPDLASFGEGARVVVQGRLQGRSYQAKDGTKKHSLEIVASTFQSLDAPMNDPADLPF
jgi:hypothetical protein